MSVLLLTMGPQLGITADLPVVGVGGAGVIRFRAIGAAGPVKWTLVDSTLPAEWDSALNPDGNAVTLTTSDAETGGTFRVTVRAVDSARIPVVRSFDVRVMALPLTIQGSLPVWTTGSPATGTLTVTGGTGVYVSLTTVAGSLPDGVGISFSGSTITFSGTPTTVSDGSITLRVMDSDGAPGEATIPWNVEAATDLKSVISLLGPWSYWPLDDAAAPFSDIQAGRNLGTTGGSVTTQQSGLGAIGPCVHLGPGHIHSSAYNADLVAAFGGAGKPISVVMIAGGVSSNGVLIHLGNNSFDGAQGVAISFDYSAPNWRILAQFRLSTSWVQFFGVVGTSLPPVMVISVTRSATGAGVINVNGVDIATTASGLAGDFDVASQSAITVGAAYQSSHGGFVAQLTGDVAHAALFTRVLSPSEIDSIVAAAGVSP